MNMHQESIEPVECAWEERIARAASAETLDERMRAHLAECEHCRPVAALMRALAQEGRAEELRAHEQVPAADTLFALAGAELAALPAAPHWSPRLVARVLRPVVWIERIAIGFAIVVFVAIMRWIVPSGNAAAILPTAETLEPAATATSADPASLVIALTAMLIVGIAAYGLVATSGVRPYGGLLTRTR